MLQKVKSFIKTHLRLSLVVFGVLILITSGLAVYMVLRNTQGGIANSPGGETGKSESKNTGNNGSQQSAESEEAKSKAAENQPKRNGQPGSDSGESSYTTPGESSSGTNGPTVTPKNCIVKPSACGYPDETNTGYKHTGVTLTTSGITINQDGDFIISQDNTVIDSKRIDGCVIVRAKNVTIKRSLITNCQAYYNIWMQELPGGGIRDTSNFLMEDVEVDGNNVFTNAALVDDNGKGMTIRRMDMHNVADGPHPGENWIIEDSYIHDMYVCPNDCHTDAIQSAGAINVTIRHNTILNNPANNGTGGKNAVVRIATEQGPVNGFIVTNNLMDGGNYAVQVRSQGNGAPSGVIVTNNRIVPTWRFAPYDFTGIPVVLSGNFRDDTLEALDTPM